MRTKIRAHFDIHAQRAEMVVIKTRRPSTFQTRYAKWRRRVQVSILSISKGLCIASPSAHRYPTENQPHQSINAQEPNVRRLETQQWATPSVKIARYATHQKFVVSPTYLQTVTLPSRSDVVGQESEPEKEQQRSSSPDLRKLRTER